MQANNRSPLTRSFWSMLAVGAATLSLLAFSTPVEAKGKHRHRGDHRYEYRHRGERHDHHDKKYRKHRGRHYGYYSDHGRFVVPRRMYRREIQRYRPYSYGEIYYRPHRHAHVIYRFPVYTEYGMVYRPYQYCDGNYFSVGYFNFGRPSFSFGFRYGGFNEY